MGGFEEHDYTIRGILEIAGFKGYRDNDAEISRFGLQHDCRLEVMNVLREFLETAKTAKEIVKEVDSHTEWDENSAEGQGSGLVWKDAFPDDLKENFTARTVGMWLSGHLRGATMRLTNSEGEVLGDFQFKVISTAQSAKYRIVPAQAVTPEIEIEEDTTE